MALTYEEEATDALSIDERAQLDTLLSKLQARADQLAARPAPVGAQVEEAQSERN